MLKQHYWFKAHESGYGWRPAAWQGWIVLLFYLFLLVFSFFQIDSESHSVSDTLYGFIPRFLIFSAILTIITYLKGESITWGDKGKEQHKIP